VGCGGGDSPPDPFFPLDNNTLFVGSTEIVVNSPQNGDTLMVTNPSFVWEASGKKMVFLGIFEDNISVSNNRITNVEDNIWAWHSGMASGRIGMVRFEDGFNVEGGEIIVDAPPTPLETGRPYIWAIWAWSDRGTIVTHSSRELAFLVDPLAVAN
jgi:hypothetical protein